MEIIGPKATIGFLNTLISEIVVVKHYEENTKSKSVGPELFDTRLMLSQWQM